MLGNLKEALSKLRGHPFFRSVVKLAGSTAGAQGLVVLASPILTRMYSTADFGLYGMIGGAVLVMNTVSSLRYELAITLPEEEEKAEDLLALCLVLVVAFSCLVGVALWMGSGVIKRVPQISQVSRLLWTIPLGVGVAGIFEAASYFNVRRKRFGTLSGARLGQGCAQTGLQLGLAFAGAGSFGLVVGDFISRAGSAVALLRSAPIRRYSLSGLKKAAVEYVRFPKFMMAANFLNIVSLQIPILLIPFLFGASGAGNYFLAYRVLILPMALIGGAVSQVFISEAARIAGPGPELWHLSKKLAKVLFLLYAPLYVTITVLGKPIFIVVFGAKWEAAGMYAQVMAPMVLIWGVASPLSNTLIVRNRLKESLAFTALDLIVRVVAIAIGYKFRSILVCCGMLASFGLVLSLGAVVRFLSAAYSNLEPGLAR